MKKPEQLTKDQHDAINWTEGRESGGLWMDVGTGKTVVLLTAIRRLIDRFDISRVLIIGPRLVVERVWKSEAAEWEHLRGLRVSRIVGTPAQRLAAMAVDADIYTLSRDNVCWLEALFIDLKARKQIRRWPWDAVVLDESQSFKSQSSKRFKSMRRLRRLFSRCYLATGSFLPNGYRDAWSQLYLLDGGTRLGKTESEYLAKFFTKDVNDGIPTFTLKEGAAQAIDALISDVFFVMRDAQPPAPINRIKVQLSKEELARYRKMVRTSVLQVGDAEITAVSAGVLFNKLAQLSNGAAYDEKGQWHEIHTKKLEALVELLESIPRPLLIGYSFRSDIERIQAALAVAKVAGVGVIREPKSLDAWQRGEIQVGILHPLSAGHGLNTLQNATTVVWFGLTPNLESFQQLNGRVIGGHRRAGRNICVHQILAEHTLDEELQELLQVKDMTQQTAQIQIAKQLRKEHADK